MIHAKLNDFSLGKKMAFAIAIFLIPIALMGYFLVTEKDDLINFTLQEVAGVHYLKPAQHALAAASKPAASPEEMSRAAAELEAAEAADRGGLSVTSKTKELVTALKGGKDSDAGARASELISLLSDNSNITLDPDGDAYFVGDMLVNQATGILNQAKALITAAHDLGAAATDDNKTAYAEARDGLLSSSGNLSTDMAKAIKGNADGKVQAKLSPFSKT